jgi:uncharacterized protein YciI
MTMGETFYVAISVYQAPEDVILDHLVDHRAWSKLAYDSGVMLFSGRQDPPLGGVLGFRARDRDEAEEFLSTDPFAVAGVAVYQVIACTPTGFPWRSAPFDQFVSRP